MPNELNILKLSTRFGIVADDAHETDESVQIK